MRIAQIIQGIHNPSAGPTYSVARLADELYKLGENASVLTLGRRPVVWPYEAPLSIHGGFLERKTGTSIALMRDIRTLSTTPCILHGHGIWRLANLFPLLIGRDAPGRIVFSPRGMLSPWSMQYKELIKQPFWRLLQKPALQRSHCFHVTAAIELEDIRRAGLHGPVAVIPNGVDMPVLLAGRPREKRVVFLSRIDPKKGLDLLLPAWAAAARDFSDWNLVIAGRLNGAYADTVQALARELQVPRVTFVGEVLGEAKQSLLSSASLFVLPTYSENFGIAVAEALAHGTPVITTTETPWTEVSSRNCGWCIAPDQDALSEALRDALGRPLQSLHKMGENGRKWMEDSFAWPHIAQMMKLTYEWLLYGTMRPDCVVES